LRLPLGLPGPLGRPGSLGPPWRGRRRPLDLQPGDGHVRFAPLPAEARGSPHRSENPVGPSPIPTARLFPGRWIVVSSQP
jgi:hypothetical protein